jgi:hypothetical protein
MVQEYWTILSKKIQQNHNKCFSKNSGELLVKAINDGDFLEVIL